MGQIAKIIKSYFTENRFLILLVLSLITFATKYILNYWALDKGIISSDEGWYMILQDRMVVDVGTHEHLIFGLLPFTNDIFYNRLTCYILSLFAIFTFSYGIWAFIKYKLQNEVSFWIILGILCLGSLYIESCSTLNYTQLVPIIIQTTLGLLLTGLACNNKYAIFLAGFVFTLLFPVKITSLSLAPFLVLFIFLVSNKAWKFTFLAIIGFFTCSLLYCVFVESPAEITNWFNSLAKQTVENGSNEYGLVYLLKWLLQTLSYCVRWTIISIVLAFSLLYLIPKKDEVKIQRKYIILLYCAIFVCLIYFIFKWRPFISIYPYKQIIWILAISIFVLTYKSKHNCSLWAMLLLFVTPICASFGTNVNFVINHSIVYVCAVLPFGLLLPQKQKNFFTYTIIVLFCLNLFSFFKSINHLSNWHGDVYNEQMVPVSSIGINQNVRLDQDYINRIKFYKDNIPENASVLVSMENWSIPYLLEYNVLDSQFHYVSDSLYTEIIKQNIHTKDIYIIHSDNTEHDKWDGLINTLSKQNEYSLETDSLGISYVTKISATQ